MSNLSANAQKVTREIIDAENLEKVVISADEVFKIDISTHSGKDLVLTTRTEGEYFKDISLKSEFKEKTLLLKSIFRENLRNGNDKLSAHKVFSMELELKVPLDMVVEIDSNLASVSLSGKFSRVFAQLRNGSCFLTDFGGNAIINTIEGNISGTVRNISVEASSRNGEIALPKVSKGNHKMVVTSINGDIKISETK
jgi:hypothetical protein